MLASPSICPPDRKNASMRPCPAQSNSSRPPSVNELCLRLPRIETRSRPPERTRARWAALPGMGERAPTATCPSPSSIAAIAVIMISMLVGSPAGRCAVLAMMRQLLAHLPPHAKRLDRQELFALLLHHHR